MSAARGTTTTSSPPRPQQVVVVGGQHARGMGDRPEKRSTDSMAATAARASRASLPLYVMLGLTVALFGAQLALSHVTHALTLLVDSYHMLCNIIALTGCIITIKKGLGGGSSPIRSSKESNEDSANEHSTLREPAADRRLRNTFGWARIDVLVSLIGSVFLASLCFSLLVEAVQTLLHIDHHDEMHEPLYVAAAGGASICLNVLCYILLGGYTFHQGSFFHVTENGDVVLEPAVTQDSVKMGERRLSSQRRVPPRTQHQFRQRQGFREMFRDTIGGVLVIITSLTVFFTDQSVAKYADPLMSIVSAVLLLILSYPYMKEAGLILLQTIPEHININQLRSDFQQAFPDVENIHDLHVWRLNQAKVFCTAHVRFRNARDYLRISRELSQFFEEYGVTQVTVQPEFHAEGLRRDGVCLMSCPGESCIRAHCCEMQPHYIRIASDLSLPAAVELPAATTTHLPAALPLEMVPAAATTTTQVAAATTASATTKSPSPVDGVAASNTKPSEVSTPTAKLSASTTTIPAATTTSEEARTAELSVASAIPAKLSASTTTTADASTALAVSEEATTAKLSAASEDCDAVEATAKDSKEPTAALKLKTTGVQAQIKSRLEEESVSPTEETDTAISTLDEKVATSTGTAAVETAEEQVTASETR